MATVPVEAFGLGSSVTAEEQVEFRRNELRNLLNSYADEADVFSEMIQNGLDSLLTAIEEKRFRPDETPTLMVFLGRRSNDSHYFAVFDNGLGMEPALARTFTIPGKTAKKKQGRTLGHKGVGASFFVAASERFALWTQDASGAETQFSVRGAISWVRNDTGDLPVVTTTADLPKVVQSSIPSTQGTCVCYYFHKDWKPTSLSHIVSVENDNLPKEIGNWASFFCSKTSLGQVSDLSSKGIRVRIIVDRGGDEHASQEWTFGEFDRAYRHLGYAYPHRVFQVAKSIAEIDTASAPKRDQMRNTLQAVRLRWDRDYIKNGLSPAIEFTPAEQELVSEHFEFIDLFFAYSTSVMDEIRNRIGAHSSTFRYGIRLAVDGAPQGRMMDFSLTSSQGLDRQIHALISFRNLTLDTGRKIPADETVAEVVRKVGVRAVSHVKDYRIYMRRKETAPPAHNLTEWREKIAEHRKGSLVGRLFSKTNTPPPIHIDPDNESDTIALYCGMVSAGFLKGLSLVSLSGYNAYDGLVDYDDSDDRLKDHSDALSVRTTNPQRVGPLKVLEFKHVFVSVLEDFDTGKKNPKDIDLLVCWDLPNIAVRRGTIEYWYADRQDLRELYGATHIWRDDNNATDIAILSLKHITCILLDQVETAEGEPGIGHAKLLELTEQDRQSAI